jgi:hypothetical protein
MYRGKKNRRSVKGGFARKPDFIMINNIYENLSLLVDNYGIIKVIQHLGVIANEKISKELASKIWYITSKPEERESK